MTGFSGPPLGSSSGGTLTGVSRIKGPRWAKMPLVTVGMLGLQIVWSVEMGYASPYLLSLGLSKSFMSVVFVAGPLSGLVVQPLIGVLADQSRSKYGRRRPYIIGGSLLCVFAIILLGFTRSFSGIFTPAGTKANDAVTIALAVLSIYCIDFSINAVQAADRALLVDLLPPSEQETGNAWAGRMFGVGSVAGFFVGNIDLPKVFPLLGRTELEVLSVITSVCLIVTHGITSASVTEKVLVKSANEKKGSMFAIFRDIWVNMRTLPKTIRQICWIQFFAWIGWFPVLFFSTVYVGEIYTREALAANPSLKNDEFLQAEATRAGSRALLWSSVLTLASSIVLPYMVIHSSDNSVGSTGWRRIAKHGFLEKVKDVCHGFKPHISTLWAISNLLFAVTMGLTYFTSTVSGASFLITLTGFCWAVSQWIPFSLLGEAILSESASSRYTSHSHSPIPLSDQRTLTRTRGGEREVLMFSADEEFDDDVHQENGNTIANGGPRQPNGHGRVRSLGDNSSAGISGVHVHSASTTEPTRRSNSRTEQRNDDDDVLVTDGRKDEEDGLLQDDIEQWDGFESGVVRSDGDVSNNAGIILGIHNIFVVIPQFLVTGLSSIIFAILEPSKSAVDQHNAHPAAGAVPPANVTDVNVDGAAAAAVEFLTKREAPVEAGSVDSVGLIFRIGGVSALIAFVLCWKLSRDLLNKGVRQ